jgi:hypothetical protein
MIVLKHMSKYKLTTFILLLVYISSSLNAQKQANVWHFGDGNSIDFSSGEPVEVSGSANASYEGSASYCDSLGNLLFYSNGGGYPNIANSGNIWNSANQSIYDMQGVEGGGYSAMQSSVFIEAPGEPGKYYLFTMEEVEYLLDISDSVYYAQPLGRGLSYFKIDQSLNNGSGEVIETDSIYSPSYEGLCAIKHANGYDYWILIHQDTSGIGIYSVTSEGMQLSSVYSIPEGTYYNIKASPDGSKLFVFLSDGSQSTGLLLQFDPTTGSISNPLELDGSFYYEFSPNSRYLYLANSNTIGRFDLSSSNIALSYTSLFDFSTIDEFSFISQMQLGPDGKLYVLFIENFGNGENPFNTLNRISCPNTESPVFEYNVITYIESPSSINFNLGIFNGLPNFPAWIFQNNDDLTVSLGPEQLQLCENQFPFTLNAQNPGASYLWSTGATSQTIQINQAGEYWVQVTGPCGIGTDTIIISPCSVSSDCSLFDLGDTLTVCGTDTVQLQADLSSFPNVTGLSWTGGSGTFIPSNTVAAPRYVPTAAEREQGFVNLSLQVDGTNSSAGQDGKLIAYDHLSEDLIFYISPLDGSIDTIQDNAGDDWIATGFESATSTFYGISAFLGLGSIDIQSGAETPITFGYQENIFSGEYDNTNGIFYAVGFCLLH